MLGTIISAGASLLGSWIQRNSARAANQANIKLAAENREWQEYMSNTAHQREVQDLIAAGLNPILSVNQSGASTPSGAVASLDPEVKDNPAGFVPQNVLAARLFKEQKKTMETQRKESEALANKYHSDVEYNAQKSKESEALANKYKSDVELNEILKAKAQQDILTAMSLEELNSANAAKARAEVPLYQKQMEYIDKQMEQIDRMIELTIEEVAYTKQQTEYYKELGEQVKANLERINVEVQKIKSDTKLTEKQVEEKVLDVIQKEAETIVYEGAGKKIVPWVDKAVGWVGNILKFVFKLF